MLVPDFTILPQRECATLYLLDTTVAQSSSFPGGYGGTNIAKTAIQQAIVTLDFGGSGLYSVTKVYSPGETMVITAEELYPFLSGVPCHSCNNQAVLHGLGALPSGCVKITYEPRYENDDDEWVTAGRKSKQFILKCVEVYRAASIAERIFNRWVEKCFDINHTEADLRQAMAEIFLIQGKLDLLEGDDLACDCVMTDLAMINHRLNAMAKW